MSCPTNLCPCVHPFTAQEKSGDCSSGTRDVGRVPYGSSRRDARLTSRHVPRAVPERLEKGHRRGRCNPVAFPWDRKLSSSIVDPSYGMTQLICKAVPLDYCTTTSPPPYFALSFTILVISLAFFAGSIACSDVGLLIVNHGELSALF